MSKSVLLVDDDRAVRDALGQTLMLDGYDVTLAASYIEAKDHITPEFGGVIVSDIRMPGKDGFDLLAVARGDFAQERERAPDDGGMLDPPREIERLAVMPRREQPA